MKNVKFLVSTLTLVAIFVFVACKKETLKTNLNTMQNSSEEELSTNPSSEPEVSLRAVVNCFPTWSFGNYPFCADSDFTLCETTFPPFPPDVLANNQATGSGFVNEEGDLIFDLNQTNLDQATIEDILGTQTFTIAEAVEFPQDVIAPLYEAAGFAAPAEGVALSAGMYPIIIDGQGDPVPRRIKIRIRITLTAIHIIITF